jgi:hypothetical protein
VATPLQNGSLERLAALERGHVAHDTQMRELRQIAHSNRERLAVIEHICRELETDLNAQGSKVNTIGRNVWLALGALTALLGVSVPVIADK